MDPEMLRFLSSLSLGVGGGQMIQSAYWDMLHDNDRNAKYYEAIKKAVGRQHAAGKKAIVLDIGTGCGILAMMAAKAGADLVYACEEVYVMNQIAMDIFTANGFASKIFLIPKRSEAIQVGGNGDMKRRANILVTEVFASGFFDEGAVQTINDARRRLITEDAIVIPHCATIYAQVVDCPIVAIENSIDPLTLPSGVTVQFPKSMESCCEHTTMDPAIQLSNLSLSEFTIFSDPLTVFSLEFGSEAVGETGKERIPFKSRQDGKATAIFSWWELELDFDRQILISLSPPWAGGGVENVRYHWSPLVSYGHQSFQLHQGNKYYLEAFRGTKDVTYRFAEGNTSKFASPLPVPGFKPCYCHFHEEMYPYQLRKWGDAAVRAKYVSMLSSIIVPEKSQVLCLTDSGSTILHILAHFMGAKKVYIKLPPQSRSSRWASELTSACGIKDGIVFIKTESLCKLRGKIDVVVADPFFFKDEDDVSLKSFVMTEKNNDPTIWHHLRYFAFVQKLRINPNVISISPVKAVLRGVLMSFDILARINAPIDHILDGEFNVRPFADYYKANGLEDPSGVEHEFLWEYEGVACGRPFDIMEFNYGIATSNQISKMNVPVQNSLKTPNAVAMWINWYLTDEIIFSTGPLQDFDIGDKVSWAKYSKQAVKLRYTGWKSSVKFTANFNSRNSSMVFKFDE